MALDTAGADGWSWGCAYDATVARSVHEGWSQADLAASMMRASLLSYRSARDAAAAADNTYPGTNFRYMDSAPEAYMHNCP